MSTVSAYFKEQIKLNDFKLLRYGLFKLGIKSSYDDNRVILTYDQDNKNDNNTKVYKNDNNIKGIDVNECNGLILDRKTYNPLVIPVKVLRKKVKLSPSVDYKIYYIEDGTVVNLYYLDNNSSEGACKNSSEGECNNWLISTANGYEMNKVTWDTKTYQTVITECLADIGLTWETFTSLLNKEHCYTFGFKHPEFHKFYSGTKKGIYKFWFVQHVRLSDMKIFNTFDTFDTMFNSQKLYEHGFTNNDLLLKDLNRTATNALQIYTDHVDECNDVKCDNHEDYVNYGYIIKSDDENFIIESSLLQKIRTIWYNKEFINLCKEKNWNKTHAVILNSYLDNNKYKIFLQLFPQYKNQMEDYSRLIYNIISDLINRNVNSKYKKMRDFIFNKIKIPFNGKSDVDKRKILSEVIINVKCMDLLMDTLSDTIM